MMKVMQVTQVMKLMEVMLVMLVFASNASNASNASRGSNQNWEWFCYIASLVWTVCFSFGDQTSLESFQCDISPRRRSKMLENTLFFPKFLSEQK